ncbi:TPA: CRISPR-associated helicase Cas3' [Candidatus Woesearchaeota archaeon]|nr:CRISPR-associated helicase Cas3' [Candidatus Woesearchaeota archaeon]
MEFYSHWEPKKILLEDHLGKVGRKSFEIIQSKEFNNLDKEILADISHLIGISHDFGKFTSFFQEKLKGLRDKNDPKANHGLLSALFVFEMIDEYLKGKNLSNEKLYNYLPLFSFFVVKHHHGNLNAIENDVKSDPLLESGFRNIKEQLEDIENNIDYIQSIYKSYLEPYKINQEKVFSNLWKYKKDVRESKDIEPLIKEIDKSLFFFRRKANKNVVNYLIVLLLYSVLIDSDKKHAGDVRDFGRNELQPLSPEIVDEYLNSPDVQSNNTGNINKIRKEIRASVLTNIKKADINRKIFTLTAPTGTGKTLTSFSSALVLRNRLKEEMQSKEYPRIIYSLPFTSIIDQNFTVFDNVLKQIKDYEQKESQYLLKHHHLSDIMYKTEDIKKEEDIDESLALIESWESEIIVTTFIQLFHTLIGYKNRALKKFHNIVNSIILLDEVQNIPHEYWAITRHILLAITDFLHCRVILMTATKPLIFREGEYIELVDDYEKYFRHDELNRVCLEIIHKKQTIDEFYNSISNWDKNSYLFVFNTINSSIEFYNKLKTKKKEREPNYALCYLSTNITPKERRDKIVKIKESLEKIKKALKDKKKIINGDKIIVISTQLIEAGVDIDCESVYRDYGPLDSIIQVAGRCNRNKGLDRGEVHLVRLMTENNRSYTGIYDVFLINIVDKIFENKDSIPEHQFLEIITEYFSMVKQDETMPEEYKIMEAIDDLYFYDMVPDKNKKIPISDFRLIKEDYYKIDVFVEIDKDAEDVWKRYKEIIAIKDTLERKKEFLKIKRTFYDYIISIPKEFKNTITNYDERLEIGYISKSDLENLYSFETGFKRNKSGSHTMMC